MSASSAAIEAMLVAIEWNAALSMGWTPPAHGEGGDVDVGEAVNGDIVEAVGLMGDGMEPDADEGDRLPAARAAHVIGCDDGSGG